MSHAALSDYWLSTNSPRNIFKVSYHSPEIEVFLRENVGVDAAILAEELHLCVDWVQAYQRRLGLRKCAGARTHRKG